MLCRSNRQTIWTSLETCFAASPPAHEYYKSIRRHPECQHQHQQQRIGSPSYPFSTAWDSRSSRKINLPPCQREPASLLFAVLVHSTEAGDFPRCHNKTLAAAKAGSKRALRGGGESEQPTPMQLSSSLNQCHSSSPPQPLCLPLLSRSLLLWHHRFLFGPAHSCTRCQLAGCFAPPPPNPPRCLQRIPSLSPYSCNHILKAATVTGLTYWMLCYGKLFFVFLGWTNLFVLHV